MTERMMKFADLDTRPVLSDQQHTMVAQIESLCQELDAQLRGDVRFDRATRALYATDASNFRMVPIGVVMPRDDTDVLRAVGCARKYGVPVLQRGDGTALAGQTCNAALIIDNSKYFDQIIRVDVDRCRARVQPGVVCDELKQRTLREGLTWGPAPATHEHCTFGGMLGNNAGGIHAIRSGITVHNVQQMDVLTYDGARMKVGPTGDRQLADIIAAGGRRGQIYADLVDLRDRYEEVIRQEMPDIPRRVSGYNLDQLLDENGFNVARALVGSEGTCVNILEATVDLIDAKPCRTLVVIGYEDVFAAAADVPRLRPFDPVGLEGIDSGLIEHVKSEHLHPGALDLFPAGEGYLLVEFGADTQRESDRLAEQMLDEIGKADDASGVAWISDPNAQDEIWAVRESGLGATARPPDSGDTWPGWEDSAVAPDDLGDYLRDLQDLYDEFDLDGDLYGHFGQGLVHTRINFDLRSPDGVSQYRSFLERAAKLVASYDGSLTGEHGDGQQRGELLETLYGPELVEAFREFKHIWDPSSMMNPGKVTEAYKLDEHLRLGADYDPWEPDTYFQYPDDDGSFSRAASRCVGVGQCRRTESGTMCPSFQVTSEEMHTTRGRAHLLFEMLNGEETPASWQNEDVKEALDLCLACKGCKNECPVSVDMATYKAEFLAHYFEHNNRPRVAYSMGLIDQWAKLASQMPRVVNAVTQTPGLSDVAKKIAGIAPERSLPTFADQTFRAWFDERVGENASGRAGSVVVFPDTFNNHLHPYKLKAAVRVLERLGYRVELPPFQLCCGRPLYDYGMLDRAQEYLRRIMAALEGHLDSETLMVGVEPSCVAVFRDELTNFFPDDPKARQLSQTTVTLGEFLERACKGVELPTLDKKAIVHAHCHHKSVMGLDAHKAVLDRVGLSFEVLDSGCCGMAGSFGFEADNYGISRAVGERVLIPRVEAAEADTLIITDGFSCHTQIQELTGRTPVHLAQVLDMAFDRSERSQLDAQQVPGGLTRK